MNRVVKELAARPPDATLARVKGTYRFDVEGVGKWYLRLANGAITAPTRVRNADCVIECSADDFFDIAEGRRNVVTAFLQGRMRVGGDIGLALAFRRLVVRRR